MNKVLYKKSLKKIYINSGIFTLILFAIIFLPMAKGVKTPYPNSVLILMIILLTLLAISWITVIRKCQNARCPKCNADLFSVIEIANNQKIPTNHCISCGERIEI